MINKYNSLRIISLILILIFLVAGCNSPASSTTTNTTTPTPTPQSNLPEGEPSDTLINFYQSLVDNNWELTYNLLSDKLKEVTPKEDFMKNQNLIGELGKYKDFKVTVTEKPTALTIENNKFEYAVKAKVTFTVIDYTDKDREKTSTIDRYIVAENKKWKIYIEDYKIKKGIAEKLGQIGYMYWSGKGKEKNLNESAMYLKEAISYDDSNAWLYFCLGNVYEETKRYDLAIESINTSIDKVTDDNELLSNDYNLLGIIYGKQGKVKSAIEAYKKAIEINPNNDYAKDNLRSIQ